MEKKTRELLVELARTVLRVLGEEEVVKSKPAPAKPVAAPAPVAKPQPALPLVEAPPTVARGDAVRIWTGSMYAVGTVDAICRGTPKKVKVRVHRGEGRRDSLLKVDMARAELVKRKGVA